MASMTTIASTQLSQQAHAVSSGFKWLRRKKAPWISFGIIAFMAFIGVFGSLIAPHNADVGNLPDSLTPPFWYWGHGAESKFLLGTDFHGRDMVSRILVGARITMLSAVLSLVGAAAVGSMLGLISGYVGGWLDALIMRTVDFMLAMPGLIFAMIMVAALGPSLRTIVIVVIVTGWVGYARFVRGEVLSLRERDYVTAAKALGARIDRILLRHILPNVMATIVVLTTLGTGGIILFVAALSFLGLGIPKPTSAWGVMIADGRPWLLQAWWISVLPGIVIALLITSFNLVGDWMRDTFDPRLRGR